MALSVGLLQGCVAHKSPDRFTVINAASLPEPWQASSGKGNTLTLERDGLKVEVQAGARWSGKENRYSHGHLGPPLPVRLRITYDAQQYKASALDGERIFLSRNRNRIPAKVSRPAWSHDRRYREIRSDEWQLEFDTTINARSALFTLTIDGLTLDGQPIQLPPLDYQAETGSWSLKPWTTIFVSH